MKKVLVDLLSVLYSGEKLESSLDYLNCYEKASYKINDMSQVLLFLNDIKDNKDSDKAFRKGIFK
jgi:hypothetical protein